MTVIVSLDDLPKTLIPGTYSKIWRHAAILAAECAAVAAYVSTASAASTS